MWLSQLFIESPINFEKRCRNRIITGMIAALLGAVALGMAFISRSHVMVLYLEPGYREFVPGFYGGTGVGLMAAGIMTAVKNRRYLKDPELAKVRKIYETDERNRLMGLRCWAYAGYTVMIVLYIGILVSGFISLTVSRTLMVVIACYAVILLVFRRLLQKAM